MKHTISIIGCGPGSPAYLTREALDVVSRAEVLIGAERLLALFPDGVANKVTLKSNFKQVLDEVERLYRVKRIAVLVSGDPGIFSYAKSILTRFGENNCTVIPGISSVQLAFAKVGLDWFDAKILSAHHTLPDEDAGALASCDKIAVLTGHDNALAWVRHLARDLNRKAPRQIIVCENLCLADERVREIDLDDLTSFKFSRLSIVLLIRKEDNR